MHLRNVYLCGFAHRTELESLDDRYLPASITVCLKVKSASSLINASEIPPQNDQVTCFPGLESELRAFLSQERLSP